MDKLRLFNTINSIDNRKFLPYVLGLRYIIDDIFEEYKWEEVISQSDYNYFLSTVELLKKTSMDESYIDYRIRTEFPNGRESMKFVKNDKGEWHPVNKLNTSYTQQADLLSELIYRGYLKDNDRGLKIYNKILENPEKALLELKPFLKRLIIKYFIEEGLGLDDFKKQVNQIEKMSSYGSREENRVRNLLKDFGYKILYPHVVKDGDYVDMVFGCDMIVWREDVGYKTIQVKSRFPGWKILEEYKVDWVVFGGEFWDLKDKRRINVE